MIDGIKRFWKIYENTNGKNLLSFSLDISSVIFIRAMKVLFFTEAILILSQNIIFIQKVYESIIHKPFKNLRKGRENEDRSIIIHEQFIIWFANWANFCKFNLSGNLPNSRALLKIEVRGMAILTTTDFTITDEIPSIP